MIDIGSGCGRLVEYVSKHGQFPVDGVEIDEKRYKKSIQQKKFNTQYIYNDFENVDFSSYNILYCCNVCFDKKDNHRLYHKILKEFKGLCILFEKPKIFRNFFHKQYFVKTTWPASKAMCSCELTYSAIWDAPDSKSPQFVPAYALNWQWVT